MHRLTLQQAMGLAVSHHRAGRLPEAERIYRQVLTQEPNHAEALHCLGVLAYEAGNNKAAIELINRAIALNPDSHEIHNSLATVLRALGKLDESIDACARAIQLNPRYAAAFYNMANAFHQRQKLDEAVAAYARAIELQPDYTVAHDNLAIVLIEQGRIDEALASYGRAMALEPDNAAVHSNRLFALHFHPRYDAAAIFQEHRRWNHRHAERLKPLTQPFLNDPAPLRRLKVGYVSRDFREHPPGAFLLPLLKCHDRNRFEIYCYSDVRLADRTTETFRALADHWRETAGVSDQRAAELVRQDRIDILVDLTMHLSPHRLLVFARKPAPVQIAYLAYCSTTGLDAMDYRFTDAPRFARSIEASYRTLWRRWCEEPHRDHFPHRRN